MVKSFFIALFPASVLPEATKTERKPGLIFHAPLLIQKAENEMFRGDKFILVSFRFLHRPVQELVQCWGDANLNIIGSVSKVTNSYMKNFSFEHLDIFAIDSYFFIEKTNSPKGGNPHGKLGFIQRNGQLEKGDR
jgi:hypothetical protein